MKKLFTCITMLMLGLEPTFAQSPQTSQALINPGSGRLVTMPTIFPTPVSVKLGKGSVVLGNSVALMVSAGTDPDLVTKLREILTSSGVSKITTVRQLPSVLNIPHIILGTGDAKSVRTALARSGAKVDSLPEGYTIASLSEGQGGLITLAGHDADGLFYALETFSQLASKPVIPALVIQDHPATPIRGTVEGFYGAPWSTLNRIKHIDFLATVKANTYIYSPKDDPYARDRWREAYPAATLKELATLVTRAQRNHVNFVYAISPGPTVCFSDPADRKILEKKFEALRSIGVHSFYVALDDIEYTKWNCEKDKEAFGPPSAEAAGVAQATFLNAVQAGINAVDPKAPALIMVPTEYYDAKETPYKAALRKNLNPKIVVQWTGTDVVPPAITINDARAATKAFGRKTLLWDNYPVNDYSESAGRLLLAPYTRRQGGITGELTGILSNPMNQEAASRPAVTCVAAFGWNDKAYDAARTWYFSARELAGGDERATAALLTFFDTQHLAPTFGSQAWQEQSPSLKAKLDKVREAIAGGNDATRNLALTKLMHEADEFAAAPDIIRSGTIDTAFAQESRPWLDAMQQWGRALQLTAAGLDAANRGNFVAAKRYYANAKRLATEATAIQSIPGATRFAGPIKIADGVLDTFIADAPQLISFEAAYTAP